MQLHNCMDRQWLSRNSPDSRHDLLWLATIGWRARGDAQPRPCREAVVQLSRRSTTPSRPPFVSYIFIQARTQTKSAKGSFQNCGHGLSSAKAWPQLPNEATTKIRSAKNRNTAMYIATKTGGQQIHVFIRILAFLVEKDILRVVSRGSEQHVIPIAS